MDTSRPLESHSIHGLLGNLKCWIWSPLNGYGNLESTKVTMGFKGMGNRKLLSHELGWDSVVIWVAKEAQLDGGTEEKKVTNFS